MLLQVSTPLHALSRRLSLSSSLTLFRTQRTRSLSCKMSAESAPLTHSITSPSRPGESVQIVASPGISDSEFRSAINSSLFKQRLENLKTDGILANSAMSLKRVPIQRVGFLKFKADIFDEETGYKIFKNLHSLLVSPNSSRF